MMEKKDITITIVRTDSGSIRIKFKDGGSYLVKDEPCNWGLISALEIELKYAKPNPDATKVNNPLTTSPITIQIKEDEN